MQLMARRIRLTAPIFRVLAMLLLAGCSAASRNSNIRETTGVDEFDGAHWVDITFPSDDPALVLDVICRGDETKIMLTSSNILTTEDGLNVLSRFGDDENNVPKSTWLTATNHKSALYDGDKTSFIRGLLSAPEFKVRVTPIGGDTLDRKFSTAGFAEALARHANSCGWGEIMSPAPSPAQPTATAQQSNTRPAATN